MSRVCQDKYRSCKQNSIFLKLLTLKNGFRTALQELWSLVKEMRNTVELLQMKLRKEKVFCTGKYPASYSLLSCSLAFLLRPCYYLSRTKWLVNAYDEESNNKNVYIQVT